ncbi:MAG: hypothetical protein ACYCX4_12365 [Bacillota bacterium]
MGNTWLVAAQWIALALAAGLIAGWTGISISLVEIIVGVIGGNFSCPTYHSMGGFPGWVRKHPSYFPCRSRS